MERCTFERRAGAAFRADLLSLQQALEGGYDGTGKYGLAKKENQQKEEFLLDQVSETKFEKNTRKTEFE